MTKYYFIFFLILFSFSSLSHSQGKIKKAEESLKKTAQTSSSSSSSSSRSSSHTPSKSTYSSNNTNNYNNNFLTEIIGGLFIQIFAYTAYGVAFESPFEMDHKGSNAFLTKHPYKNASTGNYSYDWSEDTEIFTTTVSNRFLFETNKMYGNHLNIDMRFLKRLEIELDYLQLWEENTNFGNNTLAVYTVLAKYNRVRTERFNASWGLGAAYVDGDVDKLGFTYGLGAELFFMKPFSIESNFNQTLINDNSINKFNALLNYYKKQYKFILGYEHLKIGDVGFSNFTTGVGVSF